MKLVKIIATVALLAGCAAPEIPDCGSYHLDGVSYDGRLCDSRVHRTLTLSGGFAPEYQAALIEGAAMWERAVPGRVRFSWVVTNGPADISPSHGFGYTGQNDSFSGRILIETDCPIQDAGGVLAHELGHSFGLGHSPNELELMNPSNDVLEVTPADVAHFNRLWPSDLAPQGGIEK